MQYQWGVQGACPSPPHLGKKRKELRRKKSQQGKQNKTTPPPWLKVWSCHWIRLQTLFFYGKQFKFNDKAIIKIELVVTKCSVCKCLTYHYGNNTYVQPLEDMKNYSVFLAHIIFHLHDDLSMLFLPCGGWWKRCAELRSSTNIPTLQHLSVWG